MSAFAATPPQMCLADDSHCRDDNATDPIAGCASLACELFGLKEGVRAATVWHIPGPRLLLATDAPQRTFDGEEEFRLINGLFQDEREVGVVEPFGVCARHDDDRNVTRVRPARDLALDVQTAHPRQGEIKNDGVWWIAAEDPRECLKAVFNGADNESGGAKRRPIQFAKRRIIFDDQNAGDTGATQFATMIQMSLWQSS